MNGAGDVTVVWLAEGDGARPSDGSSASSNASASASAPSGRDDSARALSEWATAHGLRIVAPVDVSASPALIPDFAVAERVEKELDRAREAIAAADADAAERALARAETMLREHPELPQGAWLRAEVHRAWATRFVRLEPRDELRARLAAKEADALDGGRAPGVGEAPASASPKRAIVIELHDASPSLVLRVDGVAIPRSAVPSSAPRTATYALEVAPAEHQVVVARGAVSVYASWISIVGDDATSDADLPIAIHLGEGAACSLDSLGPRTLDGASDAARSVACESWAIAKPAPRRGSVMVARCQRGTCGPFAEWRSGALATPDRGSGSTTPTSGWPSWATWTALGVGAVAATTIGLIAAGVFDASTSKETRFVAGGVRTE